MTQRDNGFQKVFEFFENPILTTLIFTSIGTIFFRFLSHSDFFDILIIDTNMLSVEI